MTLTGATADTYTGTTTVKGGTLILNKLAGVTAIAGPLVIGDGLRGSFQSLDVVELRRQTRSATKCQSQ